MKVNTNQCERKYTTGSGHIKATYKTLWKGTRHWKWHLDELELQYRSLQFKYNLYLSKQCLLIL